MPRKQARATLSKGETSGARENTKRRGAQSGLEGWSTQHEIVLRRAMEVRYRQLEEGSYADMIRRAILDPVFKDRLMRQPDKVLREFGVEFKSGAKVKVVEDTEELFHVVIPGILKSPKQSKGRELSDSDLISGDDPGFMKDDWDTGKANRNDGSDGWAQGDPHNRDKKP